MATNIKYHVNKKTGRAGICRATKKGCPLGAGTPHFNSREETNKFIEKTASTNAKVFTTLSAKNSRKNANQNTMNERLAELGLDPPKQYPDYEKNCRKILGDRMPKWRTNMQNLHESALNIPQSPEEVNREIFNMREDGPTLKKFGASRTVGMRVQSHSRAANGFYIMGDKDTGYIVYSNLNEIVGESKTLKGTLEYLKFEHKGDMQVYRFEDSIGKSPFNSETFEEKFDDSYENIAAQQRIFCPDPKWEQLGAVFIQDFKKFHNGADAVFGCTIINQINQWFPQDKIDFDNSFKITSYKVPKKDVVIGNDQVLYAVNNAEKLINNLTGELI